MADFTIKQNDTYPPIPMTISDALGPIDLTGCTVEFWFKRPSTGDVFHGVATVLDQEVLENKGKVQYDWNDGDTDINGALLFEVRVIFANGKRMTLPNDGYFTVAVVNDLDPAGE